MGTIDNINDLNKSDFLSIFGNVFEKTESVAQEAFESKPFKDFDDIVFKMLDIYENYKKEKILEILNAHPELAIAKKMTSESISEQASAKLNECSDDEYEEFKKLNNYNETLDRCHSTVGIAILNTSITIVFGFSILVLSNFIPTIYFGVFTGIAMLLAMISVLTLLPKLLLIYKPFGKEVEKLI